MAAPAQATGAHFTLFDTAVGRCAIAWRGAAVIGFALPAADEAATAAWLRRRHHGIVRADPPVEIAEAIAAVQRLLAGERLDLDFIAVDLDGVPDFDARIYAALRQVPPGATTTYGALAKQVGAPGAARAVGTAMARNPIPVIIPCHRVLAGGGRSGGFSAPGATATKFRLLEIEGAGADPGLLFDRLPLAIAGEPAPRSS